MKKLYTFLAAALMMGAAHAQKFTVTWNGTEVTEGETINIEAEEEDYGTPDFPMIFVEAKSNPTNTSGLLFNNKTNAGLQAAIKASVLEANLTGYSLQLCCGGNCLGDLDKDGVIEKELNTEKGLLPGTDKDHIPFQYDVVFPEQGTYGTVKTKVEITAAGQTLNFFVNFVYSEGASVNAATANSYFRPFDGGVSYSFANANPRKLSIYSADGKLLQNAQLAQRGTFRYNKLPAGIYVLEVKEKGRKAFSRKVYIY